MSQVTKEQQERALFIERDIENATSSNRHVAEERNQIKVNSEDEDEESKYGATDRRKQIQVSNQDGGVFSKAEKSAKRKKNPKATAPPGKFKTFRASVNKSALEEMHSSFLKELVHKKQTDTFFELKPSTTNLQPATNFQVNA